MAGLLDPQSMTRGGRGAIQYADGENAGKQDRKEKDKGYDGDGTNKSGDMFARSFRLLERG